MLSGIRTKLVVTICLLFLALFAIQFYSVITYQEQKNLETATIDLSQRAISMARAVDEKLRRAHNALTAVAAVCPYQEDDIDAMQRWINDRVGIAQIFDNGIFLFSANGKLLVERPFLPGRRGRSYAFRSYYQQTVASKQPYINTPYASSKTGHPAIMMTAPIFDTHHHMLGILGGSLDLLSHNFLANITQERLGQHGYFFIADLKRTIILHPDKHRILQHDVSPGADVLFDKAMNGFEGTATTVNSRGIAMLTSFVRIPTTNWILGANRPVDEIYATTNQIRHTMWLLIGGSTMLVMLVMLIMLRRTLNPLFQLATHIRHMEHNQGQARFFNYKRNDEISYLTRALNNMIANNDTIMQKLKILAARDPLTNLYNRRMFMEFAHKALEQTRRKHGNLCLLMLDLDYFKRVNDTYGHLAGDKVLQDIAGIISTTMRTVDICSRYGGEEFCALMLDTTAEEALETASRLRATIEQTTIRLPTTDQDEPANISITASIGVAKWLEDWNVDQLIAQADKALYQAKADGRNKVVAISDQHQ